jgi:hypothetical protein
MITLKSELKLKQIAREHEVRGQNILLETDGCGGREKGRYFRLSSALIAASLSVCCTTTPYSQVRHSEGAREGDDRAVIVVIAAFRPDLPVLLEDLPMRSRPLQAPKACRKL